MGKLHELRLSSNKFVQNMDLFVIQSINNVENELLNMNKAQMLASKDSLDKPLVHKSTGSRNLSLFYSLRTGKQTPNLFLRGDFQREMFLDTTEKTFFIDSANEKSGFLADNYGPGIYGIPVKDQPKAKYLTGTEFLRIYKQLVLRK